MTHKHDFIVSDEDHADWLKARALERDEPAHRDINWPSVWTMAGVMAFWIAVLWLVLR